MTREKVKARPRTLRRVGQCLSLNAQSTRITWFYRYNCNTKTLKVTRLWGEETITVWPFCHPTSRLFSWNILLFKPVLQWPDGTRGWGNREGGSRGPCPQPTPARIYFAVDSKVYRLIVINWLRNPLGFRDIFRKGFEDNILFQFHT